MPCSTCTDAARCDRAGICQAFKPADPRDDETEGDFWRDVRQAGQQKRASNREDSAAMLTQAGIQFAARNAGAHLIVTHQGATVDFWPGTGLWKKRDSRLHGRGVRRLLLQLGVVIPRGVLGTLKENGNG